MKEITTLLFDIDGTVLDTSEFILQPTEHALASVGYPVPSREVIKSKVGIPFPEYYIELTGSDKDADVLVDIHRAFQRENFRLAKIFPGALETLQYLKNKGYKLAAVTGRSNQTSLQTLKDAGVFDLFDVVLSKESTIEQKPHPAAILKALEHFSEVPERVVMIGDSHLDILAGKNAGTKTIRVTYGFHADNLHDPEPDFFIDDITELLSIL